MTRMRWRRVQSRPETIRAAIAALPAGGILAFTPAALDPGTGSTLVFRHVSHVNDPPRHPGPGQGATTKSYPGDTSKRSNAAGRDAAPSQCQRISGTGHQGSVT